MSMVQDMSFSFRVPLREAIAFIWMPDYGNDKSLFNFVKQMYYLVAMLR
jgi:hypothetical protein